MHLNTPALCSSLISSTASEWQPFKLELNSPWHKRLNDDCVGVATKMSAFAMRSEQKPELQWQAVFIRCFITLEQSLALTLNPRWRIWSAQPCNHREQQSTIMGAVQGARGDNLEVDGSQTEIRYGMNYLFLSELCLLYDSQLFMTHQHIFTLSDLEWQTKIKINNQPTTQDKPHVAGSFGM